MDKFTVGITGTRTGMTDAQAEKVLEYLHAYSTEGEEVWFAHGDCVGVDEQAHTLALVAKYRVHVYPPENYKLRAWTTGYDLIERPQLYEIRNRAIVRDCDVLLVVPKENTEIRRSGTWATKRFAVKNKTPYIIIWPNGEVKEWNPTQENVSQF